MFPSPAQGGAGGTLCTRRCGRPRGGIQAARRRCNCSPTSSEARAMVWGGLDSVCPRPRRGRTIREVRARGDGINGPLRGPKLSPPHTPHHRSLPRSMWGYYCIAALRLGWQEVTFFDRGCGRPRPYDRNNAPRGLDGTTQAPWGRVRPRGGRAGIARGEHAIGVRNPGERHPPPNGAP